MNNQIDGCTHDPFFLSLRVYLAFSVPNVDFHCIGEVCNSLKSVTKAKYEEKCMQTRERDCMYQWSA